MGTFSIFNFIRKRAYLHWECSNDPPDPDTSGKVSRYKWEASTIAIQIVNNTHFRAHYLFWPKIFGHKTVGNPGATMKIVVSAEIAQNVNRPFLEKWSFLAWVKKCFLLTVFLKSCVFLKALF